jgi:hypothetical protein
VCRVHDMWVLAQLAPVALFHIDAIMTRRFLDVGERQVAFTAIFCIPPLENSVRGAESCSALHGFLHVCAPLAQAIIWTKHGKCSQKCLKTVSPRPAARNPATAHSKYACGRLTGQAWRRCTSNLTRCALANGPRWSQGRVTLSSPVSGGCGLSSCMAKCCRKPATCSCSSPLVQTATRCGRYV